MITQEIVKNPVLEEAAESAGEEVSPEELLPLLEPERVHDPADAQILEAAMGDAVLDGAPAEASLNPALFEAEAVSATDPPGRSSRSSCSHRSVRRNRFRLLFRRLSRPGLQEPGFGIGGEALVRDLPFGARHAGRLPSPAACRYGPARGRAGCGRVYHRQPGRRRLPDGLAGRDRLVGRPRPGGCRGRAEGGAGARPRRGRRAQSEGVPAAATGEHERQGRGGVADLLFAPAPARNAPVPRAGQGAGPAAGARRDRCQRHPPPQPAAVPALLRVRRARGGAGCLISSRTATSTSSR